jgi:hypothetical protein
MPLPKLIRDKTNREIIAWLAGGAVVIVTGLWAVFIHFFPSERPPRSSAANVEASCGGVAIGGNVSGMTAITAGTPINSDCATKPKPGVAP